MLSRIGKHRMWVALMLLFVAGMTTTIAILAGYDTLADDIMSGAFIAVGILAATSDRGKPQDEDSEEGQPK